MEQLALPAGVEHRQIQIDRRADAFAEQLQPEDVASLGANQKPVLLVAGLQPPADLARPGNLLGRRGLVVVAAVEDDGDVGDPDQHRRGRVREIDRELVDREPRRTRERSGQDATPRAPAE